MIGDAELFIQIGTIIILSTLGGLLARIFRQPLIPAYILTGIVLGPWLGIITNSDVIRTFSIVGSAFLLFVIGLELDIKKLKDIGYIATFGGAVQVALLFFLGFAVSGLFGLGRIESVYLGILVALSSTMVVVKLLSDKRELNTLHGRIIIGILLMQDLIAIFALSALTTMQSFSFAPFVVSLGKAVIVVALAYAGSKWIFPGIFRFAAYSQELLFLLALSICFLFSILFSQIGFSIAIGGFVAGMSLANLPYSIEITSKIKSLRDFFATLFFVSLGLGLNLLSLGGLIPLLILLVALTVIVKPAVIMLITALFGYTKRTSFLAGISLGQISEFSFVMAAIGLSLGHISEKIMTLTVLAAVITIAITSYCIKFDSAIYSFLSRYLAVFDRIGKEKHMEYLPEAESKKDILLIGYDRIGWNILKTIERMKKSYLIIDFNPDIIKKLISRKAPCIYGDIGDPELLERLDLKNVHLVISTVPTLEDSLLIIKKTKKASHKAVIFLTAETVNDAMALYDAGADYVILPHFLGGEMVSSIIENYSGDLQKITKNKLDHIYELKKRI